MDRAWATFEEAGMLAPITRAYLKGDKRVQKLYKYTPDIANVKQVIDWRNIHCTTDRDTLSETLERQYKGLDITNTVRKNLDSLRDKQTFTITTGHQLNLLTGPLYFIYKILSVITAAEKLNEHYPEHYFVPVYWMATEDHDFEEINHTWVFNKKLSWSSEQTGMVGDFDPKGVEKAINELRDVLGDSADADELVATFEEAYSIQKSLADTMRFLVNKWFGRYGVIVVDGNDRTLKKEFAPIVKREVQEQIGYKTVQRTINSFRNDFKPQVNPREINLFYVHDNIRARILANEGGFEVLDTDIKFSKDEIMRLIDTHPERISPNVLLRPVYQEVVLPNVMYYGGGAEVAYWLELKALFEELGVSYPMVLLRNSFLVLDTSIKHKMSQLELDVEALFHPDERLIRHVLKGKNPLEDKFEAFEEEMKDLMGKMAITLAESESEMEVSFRCTIAKIQRQLKITEKKLHREFKRKNDIELQRIVAIKEAVSPGGVFQERRTNIAEMLIRFGPDFIEQIKQHTDPFADKLAILFG